MCFENISAIGTEHNAPPVSRVSQPGLLSDRRRVLHAAQLSATLAGRHHAGGRRAAGGHNLLYMRDNAPKKFDPNMTGTVAEGTIQLVRLRLGILSNGRLSTSLAAPQ